MSHDNIYSDGRSAIGNHFIYLLRIQYYLLYTLVLVNKKITKCLKGTGILSNRFITY